MEVNSVCSFYRNKPTFWVNCCFLTIHNEWKFDWIFQLNCFFTSTDSKKSNLYHILLLFFHVRNDVICYNNVIVSSLQVTLRHFKRKILSEIFHKQISSASKPVSFSFFLLHLPFLWLLKQHCVIRVLRNVSAGEEEVVRRLCLCSVAGIFQKSTASSLSPSICLDDNLEIYSQKYISRCDKRNNSGRVESKICWCHKRTTVNDDRRLVAVAILFILKTNQV